MKQLAIVVPCFNEEEVLHQTNAVILALLGRLVESGVVSDESGVYYVDDGSRDRTWALIEKFSWQDRRVSGIRLSRNRGHQNAVLAGLLTVPGDVIVTIDADLQDDVQAIEKMLHEHDRGADIVYGVRDDRSTDTLMKRGAARAFYRLLAVLGVDVVHDHADFRLMSRRSVEALRHYREVNLFLRGIVPMIGFRSAIVPYRRAARAAGESKYPLGRMLSLAWEGITSTSTRPLRLVTVCGALISAFTLCMVGFVLGVTLFTDKAVPGWASTVLPIYFLGGVQLLAIGILGEYLGKIYLEVKARPRFEIESRCGSTAAQAQLSIGRTASRRQLRTIAMQ